METFLWVLGIHVVEVLGFGVYMLIRKINLLEKVVIDQQQFIDAMGVIITNSEDKLAEIDSEGMFRADDEVGFFFKNLKEIQAIISEFNAYRKK